MTINLKLRTRLSPMQTIFALFVHGTPVAPSQRWRDKQANPKSNLRLAHQVIRDRSLARTSTQFVTTTNSNLLIVTDLHVFIAAVLKIYAKGDRTA